MCENHTPPLQGFPNQRPCPCALGQGHVPSLQYLKSSMYTGYQSLGVSLLGWKRTFRNHSYCSKFLLKIRFLQGWQGGYYIKEKNRACFAVFGKPFLWQLNLSSDCTVFSHFNCMMFTELLLNSDSFWGTWQKKCTFKALTLQNI